MIWPPAANIGDAKHPAFLSAYRAHPLHDKSRQLRFLLTGLHSSVAQVATCCDISSHAKIVRAPGVMQFSRVSLWDASAGKVSAIQMPFYDRPQWRNFRLGTLVRSTQPRHAAPSCPFEFFHCLVKPRTLARRPVRPFPVRTVIDELDMASIFVKAIVRSKKLDHRLTIGAVDYLHNIGVYVFQNSVPSGPSAQFQDCARTSFAQ
jgi:hypothetical protein